MEKENFNLFIRKDDKQMEKIRKALNNMADLDLVGLQLNTLLSSDIYNKFINSSMTIGLISGKKYYDSNTSITFDVIYKLNAFSEMENFVKKDTLFVPIVKIGKVDDLQEYFSIFLKKKFPEIKKIILVENNIGSKLYRLIIKPSGVGVFVLGSHCLY